MFWIIPIVASLAQTARNAFAREITNKVSPWFNSWVRFAGALPWCALALWVYSGSLVPSSWDSWYFLYCLGGGCLQLIGNTTLVAAFRHSSFAQSIALHKLDILMAALIGMVFYGEAPSLQGWIGVFLCSAGVLLLSAMLFRRFKSTVLTVSKYRGAVLSIGFTSFIASSFWFWSYTIMLVSYSRAIGLAELVLSMILSVVVFREQRVVKQIPAVVIIGIGILVIVIQ